MAKNNCDFEHPVYEDERTMELAADDSSYHLICSGPNEYADNSWRSIAGWYYTVGWKEFVLDDPKTGLGHWTTGGSNYLYVNTDIGNVIEIDSGTGDIIEINPNTG